MRSSGRCVAESPIRCSRASRHGEVLEALQGQGEVGAALGLSNRVDLIDYHRLGRG